MGSVFDVSTDSGMTVLQRHIGQLRLNGKRPKVEVLPEKRSLDQNSLIYALYGEIAKQKQDETVNDIRRHCKLHYGIAILKASSEAFAAHYDKVIKPHDYEDKLEMMDYIDVTKHFNKTQATEYIDTIVREYSKQGICIVMPGEL